MFSSQMLPAGDEWRCEGRLLKETQNTHSFSAKSIPVADAVMKIVENTLNITTQSYEPNGEENLALVDLRPIIQKISCELSPNCLASQAQGSLEQRTLKLLTLLDRFNWEAKIVIILAGFATNFAESFLIKEVYNTDNTMAKGLEILKGLGQKHTGDNWETAYKLVRKVTGIGKSILALKKIQDKFAISIDIIDFQSATFWVIHSVLIISSVISGDRVSTELVSTIKRIEIIYNYFSSRLKQCQALEQEEKIKEKYEEFTRIFGGRQADNIEILKPLLSCGEEEVLICNSTNKEKKIKLSDLKKGTVIVLFSNIYIDTYSEEVSIIKAFYNKTITTSQYYIVWLPIGYKKEEHRTTYAKVVVGKPWYYLKYESLAEQYVVLENYSRKEWGFNGKPMPMVLNNGQVIHHDAFSLIHMWGHLAVPFGMYNETDLWRKHGHNLGIQFILSYLHDDFTILGNDQTPQYVCVFGGKRPHKSKDARVANNSTLADDEWFGNLAGMLMAAALPANIKLKMAYLWANREEADLAMTIKTKVKTIINGTQYEESMRYVQVEQANAKLFWSRTESIALQLSMQKKYGTLDVNIEALLENTRSILQFNQLNTAWVAIGRLGITDMIFHDAEKFFNCLEHIKGDIRKWKTELNAGAGNFIKVLRGRLVGYKYETKEIEKHCFKHVVYGDAMQKEGMHCVFCNKPMKMVVHYECCECE
ncbi:Sieve element occlusion protein [Rhynchospora pubera]|uniref:Sieve element occlusion protein n=1 Tax=Rhynchospora pubera TaxID=906938 RepID=A0AAV8DHX1_9POAL|nr:Sieve element occlusion protein [Rhynchospora pubera]